jgi:hypothetical protein
MQLTQPQDQPGQSDYVLKPGHSYTSIGTKICQQLFLISEHRSAGFLVLVSVLYC